MAVSATLKNIYKGEKRYLKFQVKDINGDAVDCTGASVTCSAWVDGGALLWTVADGSFVKDEENGEFKAEVTFSESGTFVLLFQITFSNSQVEKEEFELVITDRTPPS